MAIPGFGAVFKLSSKATGGRVSIVEHPFEVGLITAPHRHSREDEHSIVVAGEIGFRSDDSEVVLGTGGYITKPRGQMHAMWNAGKEPGRIIEVITPGGFENYFRELGELLADRADDPIAQVVRERPEFRELADKYGLTYGSPDWCDDIVRRYGLNPPTH
ncbi:cupin domain-containing protein [Mycobacterium sp. 050134]